MMDSMSSDSQKFLSAEELRLILSEDLTSFIERSYYELHPGREFELAPHIEVVATRLEALRRGEIKRLTINLPPRHLKSHCVSIAFVAWVLGHDPKTQVLCASFSQELADVFAADCLRVMRSSFYRALFGQILGDRQSSRDFETIAGGRRIAASVGAALTGRGADLIVIDDPHKLEDALSEEALKATHAWCDDLIISRLNNKKRGAVIIVMQRLHQQDLVGHVLAQGDWDVLSLPAIAEVEEKHLIEGPLGRRMFTRSPGEPLCPQREDAASFADVRRKISELDFASQYQQNPVSRKELEVIEAERSRRLWAAHKSGDQLTAGRLWVSRLTKTSEAEVTDEAAIAAYAQFAASVESLENEI